jgi:Uma2 family endonuclease
MFKTYHKGPNRIQQQAPIPESKHQLVSTKTTAALLHFVEPRNLGYVLQSPFQVILARELVVQPDVVLIKKERSGLINNNRFWGAPDLIVEILSRDTRNDDLIVKKKAYSRYKVNEYWVVDPALETMEVFLWSELGYASAGTYRKSNRLISPSLPGFNPPMRSIFANTWTGKLPG